MGLRRLAAQRAVRSAHVLVVEVPGSWNTRVTVERVVRERGWRRALAPADADVLVVCGEPGPGLAAVVERVWEQIPGPRTRVDVADPQHVGAALDRAREALLDLSALREDAQSRPSEPNTEHGGMEHGGMEHGGMEHGGMEHGGMDHGGMEHGGMDHGGMDHGGMDHGGMDMAPGGIPLASGGSDRDGLEMDVLHVPLGPVLPCWPAGLVLRCSLQGDVIVSAEVDQVDTSTTGRTDERPHQPSALSAAVRLDNTARLLGLAGWQDAATQAERLRDTLVGGATATDAGQELAALRRRVARSRTLRWSLTRVRPVGDDELAQQGWPTWWAGDVHDRLLTMLDRAVEALAGDSRTPVDEPRVSVDVFDALPQLTTGLDIATARLVVASLDLDPAPVEEVAHV